MTEHAEHEKNEAYEQVISNLLAFAPQRIRGREEWVNELPRSRLPRPVEAREYLAQTEERAKEAARRAVPIWPLAAAVALTSGSAWIAATAPQYFFAAVFVPAAAAAWLWFAWNWHRRRRAERYRVLGLCRVLGGEGVAVADSVTRALPLPKLPFQVTARFDLPETFRGRLVIDLPSLEVIPERKSSILASGRVSSRARSPRERNEAYAGVAASLALLGAAAALDAAPTLESVIVSGFSPAVDPKTGRGITVCLLSVLVRRETLAGLALSRVDPVAALENFEHRFELGRGAALEAVEPLEFPAQVPAPVPVGVPRAGEVPRDEAGPSPRRQSPGASREPPMPRQAEPSPLPAPGAGDSEAEIAADALRLAIACARSDGKIEAAERKGIEELIEKRFSPRGLEAKRLELLREELSTGTIEVSRTAARLRSRLGPLERRLLIEGILAALEAKGETHQAEIRMLESVAEKLDLPPHHLADLCRRGRAKGPDGASKEACLLALELPPDANVTREAVERSARRILDACAEERFAGLGEEFRALAKKRRDEAAEARRALLASLPAEKAPPEVLDANPDGDRGPVVSRENSDLDEVFGR